MNSYCVFAGGVDELVHPEGPRGSLVTEVVPGRVPLVVRVRVAARVVDVHAVRHVAPRVRRAHEEERDRVLPVALLGDRPRGADREARRLIVRHRRGRTHPLVRAGRIAPVRVDVEVPGAGVPVHGAARPCRYPRNGGRGGARAGAPLHAKSRSRSNVPRRRSRSEGPRPGSRASAVPGGRNRATPRSTGGVPARAAVVRLTESTVASNTSADVRVPDASSTTRSSKLPGGAAEDPRSFRPP